jgi:hypothetical protein
MRKKYCISTGIEERGTVHHTELGQKKSAVTGAGNSETVSLLWTSIAGKTAVRSTVGLRGAAVWKEEAVWIEEKVWIQDDMPVETPFLSFEAQYTFKGYHGYAKKAFLPDNTVSPSVT